MAEAGACGERGAGHCDSFIMYFTTLLLDTHIVQTLYA